MTSDHSKFFHRLDLSALSTVIMVILFFSTAIIVTLIAPGYVDPTWTEPTTPYQVQMYTVADPNLYISSSSMSERQYIYHLRRDFTLLAFQENNLLRIISEPELEKYITKKDEPTLKLTSNLLMLRKPLPGSDAEKRATDIRKQFQEEWEKTHSNSDEKYLKPTFDVLELYAVDGSTAFAVAPPDSVLENWVDKNFIILDDSVKQPYHSDKGVIYVQNPEEYRYSYYVFNDARRWHYDPNGERVKNIEELMGHELGFLSRQELIRAGEHLYAIEGCWYCHSDQTRTLVQDTVLNGSESFPAPPSSANEYIFQNTTFLSTRRIGPDLSRVGIKRPSRDWHAAHFWSPKTASPGSIMPAFQHFFDKDPRGRLKQSGIGFPNYQFEAIFQYLMTKGTRITPPTEAWWLGKDPINTKEIIEGKKKLQ